VAGAAPARHRTASRAKGRTRRFMGKLLDIRRDRGRIVTPEGLN
jgi:hypothetical protein